MVMYTHAGPEISVASTKAFSVQIAMMYMLAFKLAYAKGKIDRETCAAYIKELETISEALEKTLECKDTSQFVASKIMSADSLLYLGRGRD